jgi:hypothetical protein
MPTSWDHNSWSVGLIGCVYTFRNVSKLSTTFMLIVFPESAPVSVSWDFWNHHRSKTDSAWKSKGNWKTCHFEIQPNLKRSWSILHFWPNCSRSSVLELILTLALKSNFSFQSSAKICTFTLFLGRYSFGFAWSSWSCKDASKSGACYLQCWYWIFPKVSLWIIVKRWGYSACSILSGTEFQQPGWLQKS